MKPLPTAIKLLEILSDRAMWPYLRKAKKRSFASYRICQGLRSLLPAPKAVIDIGANQGQFAIAANWWFPDCELVSFEPSPAVFAILQRNVSKYSSIKAVQSAVGDVSGSLEFFESEYSHASSALVVSSAQKSMHPATANVRKTIVPVTTLAAFSKGKTWPRPLLLKLDVQGYEKKVLEGAGEALGQVDYLLFECSFKALYEGEPLFPEMFDYVRSLGFELVAPLGHLEDQKHVILQADLLWKRR